MLRLNACSGALPLRRGLVLLVFAVRLGCQAPPPYEEIRRSGA